METFKMRDYKKKGMLGGAVGAVITLIVGVAVSTLILIFTGALSGQTYNLVEDDLGEISDSTINASVHNSIKSGFSAQEQTSDYLPIIVLAVVISLVLALVLGFTNMGGGAGRGTAL